MTIITRDTQWRQLGDSPYSVQFSMHAGQHVESEWLPRRPQGREYEQLLPSYRAVRAVFLRELALHVGRRAVSLVELP